jgi:predicted AAA+ superfamily ATPase
MFIERQIHKKIRNYLKERQIIVITGMRRVGKTTLVKELLKEIESSNKIYIDLQQIENRELFGNKNFDNILLQLKDKRGLDLKQKMYIAIDEIQLVPELPGIIKYLYDHHDIKFIVTGSSSYYMKNLFTESLSGRKIIFELYPLDFDEFLNFKNIKHGNTDDFITSTIPTSGYETFKLFYDEFIEYGGFPEVVMAHSLEMKKEILKDIINSYINIDVETLSDFKKKDDFYKLVKVLAERVGSRIDYTKLSNIVGITSVTVKNYLKFLEDTYLIHRISVFTESREKEITKAQKLYFSDTGIANILADLSGGAKFENTVFNQLKQHGEIRYYALKTGREIDFVLKKEKDDPIALEVKESPTHFDVENLAKLAKVAGIEKSRLIGRNLTPNFTDYIWGGDIR